MTTNYDDDGGYEYDDDGNIDDDDDTCFCCGSREIRVGRRYCANYALHRTNTEQSDPRNHGFITRNLH